MLECWYNHYSNVYSHTTEFNKPVNTCYHLREDDDGQKQKNLFCQKIISIKFVNHLDFFCNRICHLPCKLLIGKYLYL